LISSLRGWGIMATISGFSVKPVLDSLLAGESTSVPTTLISSNPSCLEYFPDRWIDIGVRGRERFTTRKSSFSILWSDRLLKCQNPGIERTLSSGLVERIPFIHRNLFCLQLEDPWCGIEHGFRATRGETFFRNRARKLLIVNAGRGREEGLHPIGLQGWCTVVRVGMKSRQSTNSASGLTDVGEFPLWGFVLILPASYIWYFISTTTRCHSNCHSFYSAT